MNSNKANRKGLKVVTAGTIFTTAMLALSTYAPSVTMAQAGQIPLNSKQPVTITLLTPNYYPSTKGAPRVGAPVGQVAINAIIAGYEVLHPNVKIVDITPPPWGALSSWVMSHAANGTLPDILENGAGYFTATEDPSELMDLTPYLNQPSPYNHSAKTWADTFLPGLLTQTNSSFLGPQYEIATDWYIIHALYYNATLLHKLHLSAPTTVAQLLSDLKVIKAREPLSGNAPLIPGMKRWPLLTRY